MQLLSCQPIAQYVKVWLKEHALELIQSSFVLFDNRFELNDDLKAIVEMTRPNISPKLYVKLINCRSFNMLRKLQVKDRNYSPDIVWKYLT